MRTQQPIPTMELVERYVTRMAWDTLMEWWADYRDIYAYHKQVYGSEKDVWDVLCKCIGEAGGMVLHKLGMNRFLALTELQLMEETERIAVQGGAVNKERRLNKLPSGSDITYF